MFKGRSVAFLFLECIPPPGVVCLSNTSRPVPASYSSSIDRERSGGGEGGVMGGGEEETRGEERRGEKRTINIINI